MWALRGEICLNAMAYKQESGIISGKKRGYPDFSFSFSISIRYLQNLAFPRGSEAIFMDSAELPPVTGDLFWSNFKGMENGGEIKLSAILCTCWALKIF